MALAPQPSPANVRPIFHMTHLPLRGGDRGVKQTLKVMEILADGVEGSLNPNIVKLAQIVTRNTPGKDQTSQARTIGNFISTTVHFVNESGERLQTPVVTAGWDGSRFDPNAAAGDCDDQAILLRAMLGALGIKSRFMVTSTGPDKQFSHVLVLAHDKRTGAWFRMDPTRNDSEMRGVTRAAVYDYGQLNDFANSQWVMPASIMPLVNEVLSMPPSPTLSGPTYIGRGGRATFGDTASDITNLLLPISEGAGLALAHANTQAVLVGGANIGPLQSSGLPNFASISGSPLGTLSGQVPSWLVVVGGIVVVALLFRKK